MIKVLFCASEVTPFSSTGGLADVAGSLPLELGRLGARVVIATPRYRGLSLTKKRLSENVSIRFIENEEFFNRASYYGDARGDYEDNLKRFAYFCEASLELCERESFRPDIVHANDWQAALLPALLKTKFAARPFFRNTRSVLTIHNIAYQGLFPGRQFNQLGMDCALFSVKAFEFYGKINLLKAGMIYADALNTVSPTFAKEIQTRAYGFGLEGVVRERADALKGILNGIDERAWDPASDAHIAGRYTALDLSGKALCKAALQKRCGLPVDPKVPLFAMVSRLAEQKGLDLLSEVCDPFLSENVQWVLLGEGDASYVTTFRNVKKRHPKNSAVFFDFDKKLAHQIYAGADFFLMPSYFEPCGLSQMISMRYGTLPIVRRTGGLADTVTDLAQAGGNGLVFQDPDPDKFLASLRRAIAFFGDGRLMDTARKRAMKADFSWRRSAKQYLKMYREVLKRKI